MRITVIAPARKEFLNETAGHNGGIILTCKSR